MKKQFRSLGEQKTGELGKGSLFGQTRAKIGLFVVVLFLVIALFAPWLAPNDPLLVDISHKLEGPSSTYWLGTDQLGRCIASRLIWGSRNSCFTAA